MHEHSAVHLQKLKESNRQKIQHVLYIKTTQMAFSLNRNVPGAGAATTTYEVDV